MVSRPSLILNSIVHLVVLITPKCCRWPGIGEKCLFLSIENLTPSKWEVSKYHQEPLLGVTGGPTTLQSSTLIRSTSLTAHKSRSRIQDKRSLKSSTSRMVHWWAAVLASLERDSRRGQDPEEIQLGINGQTSKWSQFGEVRNNQCSA